MQDEFTYDEIIQVALNNSIPLSVTIELLTECNWKCKHCFIPNHNNKGLQKERIIDLLYSLRKMGTLNITLTGGEIFCRKDIFEIIKIARDLRVRVFLLSNISMLDEEKIKALAEMYITEFSVSVFSLDSSIHDSITGIPGSLEKTLKNIQLLKKYNIDVVVKTPLMQENQTCYKQLKQYCDQNNLRYIANPGIFTQSDGNKCTHALRIEPKDLVNIIEDLDYINNKTAAPLSDEEYPCAAIFYSFFIDSNGDVYPCNSFYCKLGNILESSISDIWNSPKLKEIRKIKRKDLHKCNDCSLLEMCQRCPGLALLEDGDILGCSSVAKYSAIARYKSLKAGD